MSIRPLYLKRLLRPDEDFTQIFHEDRMKYESSATLKPKKGNTCI